MSLLSNFHVKGKPAVLPDRAIRRQSHYFIYRPRTPACSAVRKSTEPPRVLLKRNQIYIYQIYFFFQCTMCYKGCSNENLTHVRFTSWRPHISTYRIHYKNFHWNYRMLACVWNDLCHLSDSLDLEGAKTLGNNIVNNQKISKVQPTIFSLLIPAVFFKCCRKFCRMQSIHSQSLYIRVYVTICHLDI